MNFILFNRRYTHYIYSCCVSFALCFGRSAGHKKFVPWKEEFFPCYRVYYLYIGPRLLYKTIHMASHTDEFGRPKSVGLYNPELEKDACGVGFIVNINGERNNKVLFCFLWNLCWHAKFRHLIFVHLSVDFSLFLNCNLLTFYCLDNCKIDYELCALEIICVYFGFNLFYALDMNCFSKLVKVISHNYCESLPYCVNCVRWSENVTCVSIVCRYLAAYLELL